MTEEKKDTVLCPFCKGSGEVHKFPGSSEKKICSDCNGSGMCYPCGGFGSFDCIFCEGTG